MDENASIDDLFGALTSAVQDKNSTSISDEKNSSGDVVAVTAGDDDDEENDFSKNVLQFDDGEKGRKIVDTEKEFANIEKNLRNLPKLENGFDSLATKKASTIEKEKKNEQTGLIQDKQKNNTTRNIDTKNDWFTLPKPDDNMRRELQRDLVLLQHRAALDPKRHYKKDRWQIPDRFAVGTIIDNKAEFYSSRLTNKERKSTMLETLMGDDTTNKYFKRKYSEIQVQKTSGKKGHFKKMKSMRKKY
ncbi:Fcf2p NDAI_0C06410 [Naumovozyma dairenensis CBS 421]|uniref:Fcf2 pre-rRNA processing C-terminal domain-containing protein n=1 Tax=Naumovozyma dairenensis (strain ATCC 10597 / BCRC 20456 / CBS 421 / NBRC 0211 / NRRL Y-12639) TaxID=1071378 RepID=G0W939_NAUDC|nr:hypothetical protein NDAI_0C06410 [Naumovozyma dairenensis CBS 421]CCD24300.1 hypothetical protein NDAI_0C06410 [Naumovozyma dairenensis CBS 421]